MSASSGDSLGLAESERATCFPPAVAIGSSWNPAIAERIAAAIAREGQGHLLRSVLRYHSRCEASSHRRMHL